MELKAAELDQTRRLPLQKGPMRPEVVNEEEEEEEAEEEEEEEEEEDGGERKEQSEGLILHSIFT